MEETNRRVKKMQNIQKNLLVWLQHRFTP